MMLLLAMGCLRATGDAPFRLGRLKSALMDEQGTGAIILLTDADLSCGEFLAQVDGEVDEQDTTLWQDRGVLLQLWHDGDLNGTYVQGMVPLSSPRVFLTQAFDRGEVWSDNHPATLDLFDGEGRLEGEWVMARFSAESCRQD